MTDAEATLLIIDTALIQAMLAFGAQPIPKEGWSPYHDDAERHLREAQRIGQAYWREVRQVEASHVPDVSHPPWFGRLGAR